MSCLRDISQFWKEGRNTVKSMTLTYLLSVYINSRSWRDDGIEGFLAPVLKGQKVKFVLCPVSCLEHHRSYRRL